MSTDTAEAVAEEGAQEALAPNPLEMSDEAYQDAGGYDAFEAAYVADQEKPSDPEADQEEGEAERAEGGAEDETPDTPDEGADTDPDSPDDSGDNDESDPDSDNSAGDEGENTDDADDDTKSDSVDYKEFHAAITAPFKANGKQMQVGNVEDAIRLMQMGADYNRKMAGFKPRMAILKTLDKAGIDAEKLNFLIDLDKKDPAAIARLVKEAELDPLEMDMSKSDTYEAGDHAPDPQTLAVDEVLDEIKDSPGYTKTLDIVGNAWDQASRDAVYAQPDLLKAINSHVENKIYDVISTEIEHQRGLGKLLGLSDIAAYNQVGDALQASGGFDHLFPEQGQLNTPAPTPIPKKDKSDDKARMERRRAASSTKTAPATPKPKGIDPLAMSDEEYLKLGDKRFL